LLQFFVEGLNQVNRQPSNGLKFNRQPNVKKGYFLPSTVKTFQRISNLTISADLHGLLAPKESLNGKNQFPCSQKHSL